MNLGWLAYTALWLFFIGSVGLAGGVLCWGVLSLREREERSYGVAVLLAASLGAIAVLAGLSIASRAGGVGLGHAHPLALVAWSSIAFGWFGSVASVVGYWLRKRSVRASRSSTV